MSDYPRLMYHRDGRMAEATSAHHEKNEFGEGWTREPQDIHRREPTDGRWNTAEAFTAPVEPGTVSTTPRDNPGPVDAGTVRAIIRQEMQEHPGFDLSGAASQEDVDALSAKIDALAKALGAELPAEEGDQPRKRRGRPPKTPDNKLTGSAGNGAEE
ncbi:hypothetical protein [Methylorubrum extorquens]|uniref:Uncharacterized protein n=1 Tax=Methylorubrum extorquens (strain ATCC 14718 / DSM 1338 / JCM 2805 / NCIMB 9133 / AM1) TaxID=272630 RepID=C5B0T6_METEA|nr:hypothetical protein [Methylorubrum extorquens]ACS41673.1 Hypothetical protein MexAM1_META1p3994 [Methylorubrum extorquens AM1]MCP1545313.1 hypothetical protein [Methylorubrum extorquens]MCP1587340.1 hypothetical protein [Methylorubrum extorquens]